MKIEILGTGCPKCKKLAENARQAATDLGIECEIDKITDIQKIIERGVMMTPALVIDGEVKSAGKALGPDEIAELLR